MKLNLHIFKYHEILKFDMLLVKCCTTAVIKNHYLFIVIPTETLTQFMHWIVYDFQRESFLLGYQALWHYWLFNNAVENTARWQHVLFSVRPQYFNWRALCLTYLRVHLPLELKNPATTHAYTLTQTAIAAAHTHDCAWSELK